MEGYVDIDDQNQLKFFRHLISLHCDGDETEEAVQVVHWLNELNQEAD